MRQKFLKNFLCVLFLSTCNIYSSLWAAAPPDAGQVIQEIPKEDKLPIKTTPLEIDDSKELPVEKGGEKVLIESFIFKGNEAFSTDELIAALGGTAGKQYDLADLQTFVVNITLFYRNNFYPFAKAYLPEQKIDNGELTIQILEGNYGDIRTTGYEKFLDRALDFLSDLESGEIIEGKLLERTTLILDDQPAVKSEPIIRPGQLFGQGDLIAKISRESDFYGNIGSDNHGSRFTGEKRVRLNLSYDSPFIFGDQINLRTFYTEEDTWFGNLEYSMPIGSTGLRGNISHIHTDYVIGESFASLDAYGMARISQIGVSYPIVRSQVKNINFLANYQYKLLNDVTNSTSTNTNKFSNVIPIAFVFDIRDNLYGNAITYGTLTYTRGEINLDASLLATDSTTTKSEGYFTKLNLDIARMQYVATNLNAFLRASFQRSNKNLDSSESFGLGGSDGVRAYPTGEGYGDEGWLAKMELRYNINLFTPYAFYDVGHVRTNAITYDDSDNYRTIAGAGLGTKFSYKSLSFDTSLAWATSGGRATSDAKKNRPRWWLTMNYSF
tara:strand:+ start:684 stop:2342 length:1659 start_codon:yes stop_codon:yes gene_type:complete